MPMRDNTVNDGGQDRGREWKEVRKNQDQNAGRMRGFRWKYFCQDGREKTKNLLLLPEGE